MSLLDSMDSMDSMSGRRGSLRDSTLLMTARFASQMQLHRKGRPADLPGSPKAERTVKQWGNAADGMPSGTAAFEWQCLAPEHLLHVAEAELLQELRFVSAGDNTNATLNARQDDGTFAPLLHVVRPGVATFVQQLDALMKAAREREKRLPEMLSQTNLAQDFLELLLPVDAQRSPATRRLLSLAVSFASAIAQQFKLALICPRPVDYTTDICPMLATPAHPTLPSAHATEAFIVAELLAHLADGPDEVNSFLRQLAAQIAVNRETAGVHFRADSTCGRVLGHALAAYMLERGKPTPGAMTTFQFDAPAAYADSSFEDDDDLLKPKLDAAPLKASSTLKPPPFPADSALAFMFAAAKREWRTGMVRG